MYATQLVVGAISGLLWTAAYVMIIRQSRRDQTFGMPILALCANIAWEFLETFVYKPPGTGVQLIGTYVNNVLWLAFDAGIVLCYLQYWKSDWPRFIDGRWRFAVLIVGTLASVAIFVGMESQFHDFQVEKTDTQFGMALSAFASNLMMSILFIGMLNRRQSAAGQSVAIAVCKWLGTGFAALFWIIQGTTEVLWLSLFSSVFLLDAIYAALVYRVQHRSTQWDCIAASSGEEALVASM